MEPIQINGYDTYFDERQDRIGKYLLIAVPPHAGKEISDICGTIVNGHLITQIDYQHIESATFIKAYY